ncbi:MAG: hypothetical protein ABSC55_25625 [Syntrophorhabdales bacterium]
MFIGQYTSYNPDGYIIRIGENALISMCLSCLEAYAVSHKDNGRGKTALETYGLLFGSEVSLPDGKTLYSVELASVDTSAERERSACTPNPRALELKKDLITSFFPQYEFLGDYHSHPYTEPYTEALMGTDCYKFSGYDYAHILGEPHYWMKHHYRVGMVLTVSLLKRKSGRQNRMVNTNTIEFTFGNYRLFLTGYVSMLEEFEEYIEMADDEDVTLLCPSLMGLSGEYTQFGRCIRKPRLRHVCGRI